MFCEILVPVDRSGCSGFALAHAASIAQTFGGHITILHVMEASSALTPALANPIDWQINRMEAETYMQERSDQLHGGGVAADWYVVEGDPATQIHGTIRDHHVDLVVLSAHNQIDAASWNLGSVTQKIVNLAQTSLLIVRPGSMTNGAQDTRSIAYHKIVVPLDASQRSEFILPAAATISQKHAAQVLLAHVVERPRMPRRMPLSPKEKKLSDTVMESNRVEAERYLRELKDRFATPAKTQVMLGDSAAPVLHQLVAQEQADLVILSAHGHSSNMVWPYGSVATSFISYANTTVMIIQDMQR